MGVVVCLFGGNTFDLRGWWFGHWVMIPIPCRVIVIILYGRSLGCAKARGYFF